MHTLKNKALSLIIIPFSSMSTISKGNSQSSQLASTHQTLRHHNICMCIHTDYYWEVTQRFSKKKPEVTKHFMQRSTMVLHITVPIINNHITYMFGMTEILGILEYQEIVYICLDSISEPNYVSSRSIITINA